MNLGKTIQTATLIGLLNGKLIGVAIDHISAHYR